MKVLKGYASAELTVKNSRFLAEAHIVTTPEEARTLWKEKKATYDNGGHIVYAFITGPQKNIMGASDDGEPSGTAGKPMLSVLKGSGITNILITSARWFGGTLLGTGGLVHAYSECARLVLENAQTMELIPMKRFVLHCAYPYYEQLRKLLPSFGFQTEKEDFSADIVIIGSSPESNAKAMIKAIGELSFSRIRVEEGD